MTNNLINSNGWKENSTWEFCGIAKELYERRASDQDVEMTCHAQAVKILQPRIVKGESVLDVGCGTGFFYHSFRKRQIPIDYYGIDATEHFIETGRTCLKDFGLSPERLQHMRIEDLGGESDHVVCINVLSNIDNIYRPLQQMLKVARRTLILRESFQNIPSYEYVVDRYVDNKEEMRVHVNTYPIEPVCDLIRSYGFIPKMVTDEYTKDSAQDVIGYPHHWTFLVATKD